MDMSQYLELFLAEAQEHLQKINALIPALAADAGDRENINALFRSAHSLKGMAASMGYEPLAGLAHTMETLMNRVRSDEIAFTGAVGELLQDATDLLALLLDDIQHERPHSADIRALELKLADYSPTAVPVLEQTRPAQSAPTHPPAEMPSVHDPLQTVRVRTEILDQLIDTTGELITSKHRLLNSAGSAPEPKLKNAIGDLGRLLGELHRTVMQVRLMPFAALAERFPRIVRDLSRRTGKDISFTIAGKELELDRGILEELADPLLHIIRNAVDHGIEAPDQRRAAGKMPAGSITLTARREIDHVVISVEDDGRGMDPVALTAAAVAKGLISAPKGNELTPSEAFMLTCLPGFSTAREVTDVSGRGVGMDAVRATIQALGGSLAIESCTGNGSRFLLRLPLNIAIIQVLLVAADRARIALPVGCVQHTLEVTREQILHRNGSPYLVQLDQELPLISLNRVLGFPVIDIGSGFHPVIVTVVRDRAVGVLVDRIHGQREIHVKPVGRPLNRMRGLAGGGLLGDGEIVYILDPATLF